MGPVMDIKLTGHGVEQFTTPRLVGRRLLPADTDFLVDLHRDEEVMALHAGPRSRDATEPFVRSNVAHWRHYQFGLYVISLADEPDVPIGRTGIRWDTSIETGAAVDVSVVLRKHVWGQGIASESLRAIVSIALDRTLPLVAASQAGHAAARRVMEKVGFVYGSEYERHDLSWARYHWPVDKKAPATIANQAVGH